LVWWCEWYPDAARARFAEAGLLELKGYCFPCQHLNHSHGASSNAFTVFYAAATALEMPIWNTVVIPTLVLIHITIINCERETNNAKGNVRGVSSLLSISSSNSGNK
jgi:hypothetical protein